MKQPRLRTLVLRSLLIAGTLLFMVSALIAYGMTAPPPLVAVTTTATNNTATPESTLAFIAFLTCCNLPPAKATAQWAVVQTRIAELTALPMHTVTPVPTRPTITPASWPTGITNGPNSLPSEFYAVRNGWQYNLDDKHVIIYAGSLRAEPEQGFITVSTINLATYEGTSWTDYMTPVKAGAVEVTGAEGPRLILQADDGTRFTFDVATRQWINP